MDTNLLNKFLRKVDAPDSINIGALPSDYWPVISLKDLGKSTVRFIFGIFNTDDSSKGGEHWTAFVLDNVKRSIEYFDSGGTILTHGDTYDFFKNLEAQNLKLPVKKQFQFKQNTVRQQELLIGPKKNRRFNTFCGVYSLVFIIQRVENGLTFKQATNYGPSDKSLLEFGNKIGMQKITL